MKIAIVTFEFEGLTRNGGIGTAFCRLADLLASKGHQVTVIFMPFAGALTDKTFDVSVKKFARRGIKIVAPERENPPLNVAYDSFYMSRSYLVYRELKKEAFDVVHASDNCGLIYFSQLAKRSKIAFPTTRFVVGTHGCPKWTAEANGIFSSDSVLLGDLDHLSIEMADHVVSPSAYMLNFREAKGWSLPPDSRVIANTNDLHKFNPRRTPNRAKKAKLSSQQKKIVFFGRIERRKGIFLFVKALEQLLWQNLAIGAKKPLEVVFLGSLPDPTQRSAFDNALGRLDHYGRRIKIKMISNLSSAESLAFLESDPRHLVCMPSLVDNLPYVIVEAVERRLDFIASEAGGQSEIISEAYHDDVLCAPTAEAWALALRKRLDAPRIEVKPSKMIARANREWLDFHAELAKDIRQEAKRRRPTNKLQVRKPKVSVILTYETPEDERFNSYRSFLTQDYANVELMVPRGMNLQGSLSDKIKLYDANLRSPSAIAGASDAKYLLFLDGGVFERPSALREFVDACEVQGPSAVKCLGFSAIVRHGLFSRNPVVSLPLPSVATRAMIGHCIANTFALWVRQNFLEISQKTCADLSSDGALRPFVAKGLARGFTMATIPLHCVVSLSDRFLNYGEIENVTPPLSEFIGESHSASDSLLTSVVGFYSDMQKFRQLFYDVSRAAPKRLERRR